jgi:hypothetical protein
VPEVVETTERLAALAERSGSLKQLVNLMVSRAHVAFMSGDYRASAILAEQTLELALREGSPTSLGLAHDQLIISRHTLGDLADVEKHFTAWLAFCDDPGLKQKTIPGATVVAFGFASLNALALGRADLARQREAQMLAAAEANGNNPGDVAWSGFFASAIRLSLKEPEQAGRLAARARSIRATSISANRSSVPLSSRFRASANGLRERGYRIDSPRNSCLVRARYAGWEQ